MLFRNDMLNRRTVQADGYKDFVDAESDEEEIELAEFRAPGQHIAHRLDLIGINRRLVTEQLVRQPPFVA
jgi:hypothetical protein